jgi:hypothetical protein
MTEEFEERIYRGRESWKDERDGEMEGNGWKPKIIPNLFRFVIQLIWKNN